MDLLKKFFSNIIFFIMTIILATIWGIAIFGMVISFLMIIGSFFESDISFWWSLIYFLACTSIIVIYDMVIKGIKEKNKHDVSIESTRSGEKSSLTNYELFLLIMLLVCAASGKAMGVWFFGAALFFILMKEI